MSYDMYSEDPEQNKKIIPITGHLQWKLIKAETHLKHRENDIGTEYVRGKYDRVTNEAHFSGWTMSPGGLGLIGLDEYKINISAAGFDGVTKGWRNIWKNKINGEKDWIWDRKEEWSWVDDELGTKLEKHEMRKGSYLANHKFGIPLDEEKDEDTEGEEELFRKLGFF
jgi:hypothetical protein